MKTPPPLKTVLLWLGTIGCILLGQTLEGGHLSQIFHSTAAIIVFGPLLVYAIYFYGLAELKDLFSRVIRGEIESTDLEFFDRVSTMGYLLGALGFILGMIHVLSNLADTSKLGTGIAIAFISAFYGVLPSLLLVPLKPKEKRLTEPKLHLKKAAGYSALTLLMTLSGFLIVLFAFKI